jgi:glycosyltransferase involved in cell wall biosynthesis
MTTRISVIVLTCDSYTHKYACIEPTLLALTQQKEVSKEIIVVNNGCEPADQEKLENFICSLDDISTISSQQTSIAKARNLGSEQSTGDILLFVDDDTIVLDELALSKISQYADKFQYGFGADRWWTLPDNWFDRHREKIKQGILINDYSDLIENLIIPNPLTRHLIDAKNLIKSFIGNFGYVNKEAFKEVGGFPTQIEGYGFEDTALSFLCYLNYGEPALLDTIQVAHVHHEISLSLRKECRQNLGTFISFMHYYGYRAFNITQLLYPKLKSKRSILERM